MKMTAIIAAMVMRARSKMPPNMESMITRVLEVLESSVWAVLIIITSAQE